MKALIHALDDEPIVLEWLQNLFSEYDCELKVFTESDPFIKAFTPETSLIITDMRVPGYNFYDALDYFHSINKGVYIIVVSAYFDDIIYERLFELNVDRVVKKGHDMDWMFRLEKYIKELFPNMARKAKLLEA